LLSETLPQLAAELEEGLRALGREDLAEQVGELSITAACTCEVAGCASFYTGRPLKRWFRRGRQVAVGELVVDTIDGEIVFVEVLGRPELRELLP
jgi:hypothetical protein